MGADRPTNLAIMGIGTIGKRHLMAIEAIDTVNVCGVVDISEEAKSYCKNRNIPIFHSLNELKTILEKNRGHVFLSIISKKYSLNDVPQAHKDLEARLLTGPAVIIP